MGNEALGRTGKRALGCGVMGLWRRGGGGRRALASHGAAGREGEGEGLQKWEVGSLLDLKSGARGPGSTPNRAPLLYR